MKITACFWLIGADDTETEIFSMYDLNCIPFKVGDKISLDIDELYPADYSKFLPHVQDHMITKNAEARKLFHRRDIIIFRVGNYARFNTINDGRMTIEYHCTFVEPTTVFK